MKTTLRAKLLQHLAGKKKANEGFTLIELLVVIIIIGILAAIALPSFLNQANKARQTEATTNIGAINRGQQAYTLENVAFSRSIGGLGLGIRVESQNYIFGDNATATASNSDQILGINAGGTIAYNATDDAAYRTGAVIYAAPVEPNKLKGYAGVTYLLTETTTGETTSTTLLCEKLTAGDIGAPVPDATGGIADEVECAANSKEK